MAKGLCTDIFIYFFAKNSQKLPIFRLPKIETFPLRMPTRPLVVADHASNRRN